MEKLFQANISQRKVGVSILMSDKIEAKEKCHKGQWSMFYPSKNTNRTEKYNHLEHEGT